MIIQRDNKLENIQHRFADTNNKKTIKISNVLSSINVVGNDANNNIKEQLLEFNSGEHLQEVSDGSFEGCYNLRNIVLQQNVKYIGNNAFKDCIALSSINLDTSIYEYFGDSAFENTGLSNLAFELFTDDVNSLSSNSATNLTYRYGKNIFSGCQKLKYVSLTSNVIPDEMFSDCQELNKVDILIRGNYSLDENDAIKNSYIADNAFKNCKNLQSINIIGNINTYPAFNNLPELSSYTLSSTYECSIKDDIFQNNTNLTHISLNDNISLYQISEYAFRNSALSKIIFNGIMSNELLELVHDYSLLTKISFDEIGIDTTTTTDFTVGKLYGNVGSLFKYAKENNKPALIFNAYNKSVSNIKVAIEYLKKLPYLVGIITYGNYSGGGKVYTINSNCMKIHATYVADHDASGGCVGISADSLKRVIYAKNVKQDTVSASINGTSNAWTRASLFYNNNTFYNIQPCFSFANIKALLRKTDGELIDATWANNNREAFAAAKGYSYTMNLCTPYEGTVQYCLSHWDTCGKPDFNNKYYTCSNFSTNDMSKADAAKAHQKKYSLQNDTSFAQYIEDTFEKAFDLIMHDHADRAEAQKVLDKYNEAKAKKFTCWGIGHDCTIKTQDDVTLYWDEATQTLSAI